MKDTKGKLIIPVRDAKRHLKCPEFYAKCAQYLVNKGVDFDVYYSSDEFWKSIKFNKTFEIKSVTGFDGEYLFVKLIKDRPAFHLCIAKIVTRINGRSATTYTLDPIVYINELYEAFEDAELKKIWEGLK